MHYQKFEAVNAIVSFVMKVAKDQFYTQFPPRRSTFFHVIPNLNDVSLA
ncbi:hypothetical protein ACZ87_02504 [Candidatus Erwinia dacicola]|uniref:Uncharacterized protein n=1 Tax=Candidatus Erwinia dacicola TaxID=252393 RepID=A0A328TMR9_9GAMM|nr:hypothetical protein ACZ87_02504 [Candidatus Erwinia dacicola]